MHPRVPARVTRLWSCLAVVLLISAGPLQAEPAPRYFRIRALDSVVDGLLQRGYRESITFRNLVKVLERSDIIVHLEFGGGERLGNIGATRFAARAGGQRYLRIAVADSRWPPSTSIAVLGHELYHALEVAQSPWVVDSATYRSLYETIGYPSCGQPTIQCYDTKQAEEAGVQILAEVRGRSSGRRPQSLTLGLLIGLRR